ncbi:hypothetical protein P7K49_020620, partial [Saguinus oedipus]
SGEKPCARPACRGAGVQAVSSRSSHKGTVFPAATTPSMDQMRTQKLSCPSRRENTSTSMETWMRMGSMKVSVGTWLWWT